MFHGSMMNRGLGTGLFSNCISMFTSICQCSSEHAPVRTHALTRTHTHTHNQPHHCTYKYLSVEWPQV
jgi:hypothetical protein